jgi:hypothetical protein
MSNLSPDGWYPKQNLKPAPPEKIGNYHMIRLVPCVSHKDTTDTNPAPLLSYYLNRRATRCSYFGSFIYALNISRYWCCHSLRCRGNTKTIMILSLAKLSQGVQTPSRLWFLWQFLLASFKTATWRVGVCLLCLRSATFIFFGLM